MRGFKMESIWKFKVESCGRFSLMMPENSEILTVQVQNGSPYLWAKVQKAAPLASYEFKVYSTGQQQEKIEGSYIGTFQLLDGSLVFHLYVL